jgi:MYXO-CTERM domain-containing protein
MFLLFAVPAHAQLSFQIGMVGGAGNAWPSGETPNFAIDGVRQKYLNFAEFRTGVAVSPGAGAGAPTSIQVWTANDEEPRDPVSVSIYGTNAAASGAPGSFITGLNEIAVGVPLALPATRNNPGGALALLAGTSATASFTNATSYPTYVVVFPTVKTPASANSMQIAEVQLFNAAGAGLFAPTNQIVGGQLIPEPSTAILGSLGLALAALRRRRRS